VTQFDRRGAGQPGDTDPFAMWDAAYVLGSLDPEERRQYEAHLGTCARCREAVAELTGMPALLALLDPDQVAALDEALPGLPPPPPELLDSLLRPSSGPPPWAKGIALAGVLSRLWSVGTGSSPPWKACWSARSMGTARWSAWRAQRASARAGWCVRSR